MFDKIYHKIRHNPFLMVLACVAPILIIIGVFLLFKAGGNSWFWLLILLCPFAHVFMMKGHKHNHDEHDVHDDHNKQAKVEQKSNNEKGG